MRLLAVAVLLLIAMSSQAHPLAPSLLDLREDEAGYALVFRTPTVRVRDAEISPRLPEHCALTQPHTTSVSGAFTLSARLDCGELGLVGHEVGLGGLGASRTNALLRIELLGGSPRSQVLDAANPTARVERDAGLWSAFWSYGAMGFWHVLGGLDHLLFVTGLLLLASGAGMLIRTVTAFTLGHSVTLSAAALFDWRLPQGPVEVAIAISLVWLALVLVERTQGQSSASSRRPAWMAFGFGLFHGLGFAGALGEAGLSGPEIPIALASFNLGIEAGQILWVVALVAIAGLLARFWGSALDRARPALAHAMGGLAIFWVIERLGATL